MSNPILVFIAAFLLIATGFALILRGFPMDDSYEFMGSELERLEIKPLESPPDRI